MIDTRKQHAAAETVASRWPNLLILTSNVEGPRPLSTSELLAIARVALEAAEEVDES